MPKITLADLHVARGLTSYPAPYGKGCDLYEAVDIGRPGGLTQFGVGIETLLPGGLSSQRHWHENEDECLIMLEGEAVLIEDDGEHMLRAGDAATWTAGTPNGHHIVNRSDAPARYVIIGTRAATDTVHYPDIDLEYRRTEQSRGYFHKDGRAYPQAPL